MNDPASSTDRTQALDPEHRRQLILSIAGASMLLLAAVAIILFLALTGPSPGNAEGPTSVSEPEETSTSSISSLPACETVINSGNVQVNVAPPVSTTIKDTQFHVEPTVPEANPWTYPSDRSGVAVWICGTVVNYVIGLEPTPQTGALITSLTPGDRIELGLANGMVLPFRFAERREVSAGDQDVLEQRRPRLTLLLADGDVWQVAVADYVAEEEPEKIVSSAPSSQVGQPVRIGDVWVTVNRGHAQPSDELPSGVMYYLVEFSVENAGEAPLLASTFSMKLQDSSGNMYLASPSASSAGDHGPTSDDIEPGTSVEVTAGYVVPEPLPAGALTWIFSPRPDLETQAQITIPQEDVAGSASSTMGIDVTIDDAFLSGDGSVLIIVGEVRNDGAEPLAVESRDIVLSSGSDVVELVDTAPPLPWSIVPGQSQVVELQYRRPAASVVVLQLLGYSFEIAGLQ